MNDPAITKLAHVLLHLQITCGKLARVVEIADHEQVKGGQADIPFDELAVIAADLFIHAAQVVNLSCSDAGDALVSRYRSNAARFAPDSELAHLLE